METTLIFHRTKTSLLPCLVGYNGGGINWICSPFAANAPDAGETDFVRDTYLGTTWWIQRNFLWVSYKWEWTPVRHLPMNRSCETELRGRKERPAESEVRRSRQEKLTWKNYAREWVSHTPVLRAPGLPCPWALWEMSFSYVVELLTGKWWQGSFSRLYFMLRVL